MNKISAAIVAKGKPIHLKETIKSIFNLVEEIVIFDIGMDEGLAKELNKMNKIKIVNLKKDIPYVELIREEEKEYLKNNWVLYIDPDEIFPQKSIPIIEREINDYDCFSFPRKNIIFNRFIRYCRFWPDYQTRLFKKSAVIWLKEIHAQPQVKGKEYVFPAKEELAFLHYNYENLDQWFDKYIRYAKSEAQFYLKTKIRFNFAQASKKSITEFISRYFAGEGYREGIHGLVLSFFQMFYYFLVYFYYWESKKYENFKDDSLELPYAVSRYFQNLWKESHYWLKEKQLEKTSPFKFIKEYLKNWLTKKSS